MSAPTVGCRFISSYSSAVSTPPFLSTRSSIPIFPTSWRSAPIQSRCWNSSDWPRCRAIARLSVATRSECPRVYGSLASIAAANARIELMNSRSFAVAASWSRPTYSSTWPLIRLKSAASSASSRVILSSGRRRPKLPLAISWVVSVSRWIGLPTQRAAIAATSSAMNTSTPKATTAVSAIWRAARKVAEAGLWTTIPQPVSSTGLTCPTICCRRPPTSTAYSAVRLSGLRTKSRTRSEPTICSRISGLAPADQRRAPRWSTRKVPTSSSASRSTTTSINRRRATACTISSRSPSESRIGTERATAGSPPRGSAVKR